jgi:hypothetical protein
MAYDETEAGGIAGFSVNTQASLIPMKIEGKVQGDKLLISMGPAGTQEQPWDPQVLGPVAQQRLIAANLQAGKRVEFDTYSAEMLRKVHMTVEVQRQEETTVQGRPQRLWRTESTQDILPGTRVVAWVDDAGDMVRSEVPMLGMVMRFERCTREQALGETGAADLFGVAGLVRVQREVEDPHRVTEAVYRIAFRNPEALKVSYEDERQTVLKREGDTVTLRVRAVGPPTSAPARPPAGFEKYLKPSPYVQSEDPQVIAVAREAAGDAATPWDKAGRLRAWVRGNITAKNLSVGFASAKEALQTREGDCSEHAVLLVALLRACGVPARAAFGLFYVNSPATGGPVFGAHMWTEAWMGRWVALDATLAEPVVDAMHIRLGESALDGPSPGADFLRLVNVLGQVSIQIERIGPAAPPNARSPKP